jgi:hypothetical protein
MTTTTAPISLTEQQNTPPHTENFIKHGVYLRNWSARTVRTYRQGLTALASVLVMHRYRELRSIRSSSRCASAA